MRRLGALPLVNQPGERWIYDTAADVTGVLIARATGTSLGEAQHRRLLDPLGMKDTGFGIHGHSRPATAYRRDDATAEDLTTIVFMQRAHAGDRTLPMWRDLWATVHQALGS